MLVSNTSQYSWNQLQLKFFHAKCSGNHVVVKLFPILLSNSFDKKHEIRHNCSQTLGLYGAPILDVTDSMQDWLGVAKSPSNIYLFDSAPPSAVEVIEMEKEVNFIKF